MSISFRNIEKARDELTQLRSELFQSEKRVDAIRESLWKTIGDLFGSDRQVLLTFDETVLASRIAEAVLSKLQVHPTAPGSQKQYVRERDAADYMGVKVSTLRAWRMRRSKNGPPFARVGKMILYSVEALKQHMEERLVPPRP